ncbi:MAG: hypothetical protein IT564_10280 [Rhodospirillales bacterium]|nr:hypothetical protein [Rhodospirillales bacterium]
MCAALFGIVLAMTPAAAQDASPASPAPPAVSEPDEEAVFLSVIEDIPLMPGLVEDETRAIVFDAAQGRLAETYARGRLAVEAVREFYGETLPALGWRADGETRWVREGEALTLEIQEGPDGIDARFSLSPARGR